LWIMMAWIHDDVAVHSPILQITSAMPASGKSTMLGVISFLLPQCVATVEISEAALYRSIELWHPSFAIDEFDDVLAGDDRNGLRAVINSGHTRGQVVIRCIPPDYKPRPFTTFAPKCIGMIGKRLPAQTATRCIAVVLRRRKRDELIEKFMHEDDAELGSLRSRLRRWALDNAETLRGVMPNMPEDFDNRCADNWGAQFAIADLAGGDWGDKARVAAIKIERTSESRSTNADVLADTLAIFFPHDDGGETSIALEPLDHVSSVDLAARLCTYPDSPWCEWKGGKPITAAQLARVLKPFGISPEVIRIPGGGTIRGYRRGQFEEAWERHLGWTPTHTHPPEK
jgi:putative DNA primase/helicase